MEDEKSISEVVPKSGLTVRSLLAIIYGAVILQPIILWLYMLTGQAVGFASYIVALLVAEICLMQGKRLTRQEAFIIISCSTIFIGSFVTIIYQVYFASMPLVRLYGLRNQIPSWYAPPNAEEILVARTFFRRELLAPIAIGLISLFLGFFADLGLGLFGRELYIKQQKLRFPMADVGAQAALTISERDPTRMDVFSLGTIAALIYSLILYGFPIVSEAVFRGYSVSPIPFPFADITRSIELLLPGASFGIATDPLSFSTGFIIPFPVVVSMFVGSFSIYFVGNHFMQKYGIWTNWLPGMSAMDTYTRSVIDLWISPFIGLSVTAALLPILRRPKTFVRAFSSLRIKSSGIRTVGEPSPLFHLPLWLACSLLSIVIVHFLVPEFPLGLLIFLSLVYGFLGGLIAAYSIGETGFGLVVPYVREATLLFSYSMGYQGIGIWVAPLVISTAGQGGWTQNFKICDLTGTTINSFIIAYTLSVVLSVMSAFVFTQILWYMSPIPSRTYPATQISWPVQASFQLLWMTRSLEVFKPMYMLVSAVVMAIVYIIGEVTHIPISVIGLATGAATPLPTTFTLLVGSIIGKILQRYLGAEFWNKYRAVLVAGVGCGTAIAVGVSVGLAVMLKGLWLLPF